MFEPPTAHRETRWKRPLSLRSSLRAPRRDALSDRHEGPPGDGVPDAHLGVPAAGLKGGTRRTEERVDPAVRGDLFGEPAVPGRPGGRLADMDPVGPPPLDPYPPRLRRQRQEMEPGPGLAARRVQSFDAPALAGWADARPVRHALQRRAELHGFHHLRHRRLARPQHGGRNGVCARQRPAHLQGRPVATGGYRERLGGDNDLPRLRTQDHFELRGGAHRPDDVHRPVPYANPVVVRPAQVMHESLPPNSEPALVPAAGELSAADRHSRRGLRALRDGRPGGEQTAGRDEECEARPNCPHSHNAESRSLKPRPQRPLAMGSGPQAQPAENEAGAPRGGSLAVVAMLRRHDLRDTAASLLIAGGAYVVLVSRQLGHANVATTLKTFAHLFDAAEHGERARSAMDAALGNVLETSGGDTAAWPRPRYGRQRQASQATATSSASQI